MRKRKVVGEGRCEVCVRGGRKVPCLSQKVLVGTLLLGTEGLSSQPTTHPVPPRECCQQAHIHRIRKVELPKPATASLSKGLKRLSHKADRSMV